MTRGIHRPETGQAVIQVQSIQSSVCHHRASNTCTASHIRDYTRLRTPVEYSEQSSVKKIHRCLHNSTTHTTPFPPLSLVLGTMSTASPRRHTHDSTSRYQYYDPNANAYVEHDSQTIPTPKSHRAPPGPPDRTSSYPPHSLNNGYHTPEASTSSHTGVPRRRPPPRLIRKTSITSSTHLAGPARHSRSDSGNGPPRRGSNESDDHSHAMEHHRSGSSSSHHVHHAHSHAHRSHSGHSHTSSGHSHGHRRKHRVEPEVEIVEEVVDLEDEEDMRVHVAVHNTEQFWSGKYQSKL
jgi:hypothetical protein